jgi:hypothetical protein
LYIYYSLSVIGANPGGRDVEAVVGLRPLDSWDRGFDPAEGSGILVGLCFELFCSSEESCRVWCRNMNTEAVKALTWAVAPQKENRNAIGLW